MIQIDDAGSGSLIGGTCIGMYDTTSKEYYHEIIPLELYNLENIKEKEYLEYVIKIVQNGLERFNFDTSIPIEICRGYMFEKLRFWLTMNNYNWSNSIITGVLQEKVEKTFEEYSVSLGFPYLYIKYTKFPFHFHRILKWVYADYNNRSALCKTGWKSWQKYGLLSPIVSSQILDNKKNFHCLKCGKKLYNNMKVIVLKYNSNRENTIYLHQKCYK